MDIKKYIKSLEEKCLGETFNAVYNDTNRIATYNNHIDDTILKVFYNKDKNITVMEFYDNKYYTTVAFKTKINPDQILFYHTYYIVESI
jgi:hypothetical protein